MFHHPEAAVTLHPIVQSVTGRIIARSRTTRERYLARSRAAYGEKTQRAGLACANLAHALAAESDAGKARLAGTGRPNLAIVSAYNDMLSAHQPLGRYPAWIKQAAFAAGGSAQFAGGVPAMCDGITQGQAGMELSLFSRDVIAMSTAIALSHQMFDAALCLGVCDKIVPGMLIGALSFGHLPVVFVPAGPMPSGISNEEKSRVRQRHAQGEVDRDALLASEMGAYHAPGTCTFYGTANSNQMLMEIMGLHLPGASFVPPGSALREALTREAARHALGLAAGGGRFTPVAEVIDERALVNGIVGLLATGGSTNHTMHLVAIARAAGIAIDWDDFSELSAVVPLLARVYPNGGADVNQFQAAGGMAFLIRSLREAGLLHDEVTTVMGKGLEAYTRRPALRDGALVWEGGPRASADASVLRGADAPFSPEGGLKLLRGNLGRAVIKVSAVAPGHRVVEAPARIFETQEALLDAFGRGELEHDMIAVLRFQGPRANGMPELHQLTPVLSVLQARGHRVALVTDGRMSGASGKVPAAIHVTPEACAGGPLARLRDGDCVRLDAVAGTLDVLGDAGWQTREPVGFDPESSAQGIGRDLFGVARAHADGAEQGASFFQWPQWAGR